MTMLSIALCVFLVLRLSFTIEQPYTPTDHILLDCGSSSNSSSIGLNWQTDEHSDYLPPNAETISIISKPFKQDPSTQQVPYMTARIFHSQFTYTFSELSTGPKFIRLYFYPSTYFALNSRDSLFSVIANNYTLLSNFSSFLTVSSKPSSSPTLVKEYIINLIDDQQLNITFFPYPHSFAFVNGIELVSMPVRMYYRGEDVEIKFAGQTIQPFYIRNHRAFETLYRLNVGGIGIPMTFDTGMFRAWHQDYDYIFGAAHFTDIDAFGRYHNTFNYSSDAPAYIAPEAVYASARIMNYNSSFNYNMSWFFPVDSGFYYLLRLHFCNIFEADMVFTIFINNKTAEVEADMTRWSDGGVFPVKRDYVAYVTDPDGSLSKQNLWLEMHPKRDVSHRRYNALLNGLEIFKLSRPNGSLAAPNPLPVSSPPTQPEKKSNSGSLILFVAGGVICGVALLICFVVSVVFWHKKQVKDSGSSFLPSQGGTVATRRVGGSVLASLSDRCQHVSLAEIKRATGNFDDKFVIGVGGFGSVYHGRIGDGSMEVAIKRLNPSSNQGVREFLTEIEILSKLRHIHLVSLIGYCDDNDEMILIYDYMARGTLRDQLYKTHKPPLSWKQRLQICIGAAKGLLYLHTCAKQAIIHRDVKSTNILLDETWVAKISDFGLSKKGPIDRVQTHVSTLVKGSFGYMDPEYYRRQQLTERSDVYSFGVVLFEVLCARPAIATNLPEEQVSLARWAQHCYRNGTLDQILDPNLKDEIKSECFDKYVEIAISCLNDKGTERPTMNDVVWKLEFALKLQVVGEKTGTMMNAHDYITSPYFEMISTSGIVPSFNSKISGGFKSPEAVFSEIMNQSAR